MLESIILGIVQGLTEFLPVSSTAHLILFPWFFDWGGIIDSLSFDIALHAGTLFALIIYFRKDWVDLILRKKRLLFLIIIATLPAAAAGVLLGDIVEESLRSPYIICISLVTIGVFMFASERMYKHRKIEDLTLSDAVLIGISQAIALIPGVSRSGITISSGLFRGLERQAAARFSFLLSTPVIAGATFLHGIKMFNGNAEYDIPIFTVGFVASAITGFAAIRFLLNFFRNHTVNIFVYYRIALAIVIILGLWLKG
jgi:undecaprenyl-diphosphatase